MAYQTKWFTDLNNLKSMSRAHLTALFRKHEPELSAAGITIPDPPIIDGDQEASDNTFYAEVAQLFFRPEGLPDELHDALATIRDMDREVGHNLIIEAAMAEGLPIDLTQSLTRADCAILVWLHDPYLLKTLHLDVRLDQTKSYVHMSPTKAARPVPVPLESVRAAMEAAFDEVFLKRSRGRGSHISCHVRGGELWYVVAHGEPFKRDGRRVDDRSDSVFYRPEKIDVVVYNQEYGELRTNVTAKWQKNLYRDVFEHHLFEDKAGFKENPRYHLEPIRSKQKAILHATDDAITSITLTSIDFEVDVTRNDYMSRSSSDVFASFEQDAKADPAKGFPAEYPITGATFKVRFKNSKKERSVTIQPPNRARYIRDEDSAHVENWLREHEMIIKNEDVTDEKAA
ncbi:MAG TPA: hypothetical protein PKA21_08850 [Kiritimatiellia bacterium]|nr:hypothetical protein [Kiritimatiellia bacterium]HMP35039.1 hypothetical protein [Kiritimatiellia bacterium]